MSAKIKAGIVGGAGYAGGEVLRLLLHHPHVEISFVHSRSHAGKPLTDVHGDLIGETEILFSNKIKNADVVFLCLGHGESKKWMRENFIDKNTHVIDLSQDFRLNGDGDFTYGLSELHREKISKAKHVANPGCFATAIQLALLPLAEKGLLKDDVEISATTGSTGAGQSFSETSHFTWRAGNVSSYKTLNHQHLAEIGQTILQSNAANKANVNFVPFRGSFTRGIHAVVHTKTSLTKEEAVNLYEKFYRAHPFTHVAEKDVDVKQVVNTNKCLLHVDVIKNRIVITSVIDNLLKGAAGQAVQNMNLLFGFDETSGLKLKPSAY